MKKDDSGKITIAILQRGWVFIGRFSQDAEDCFLKDGFNIRVWGTERGLGQLALEGPTSKTILDPCPTIKFHELTVVAYLECVEDKWLDKFRL